MTFLNPGLLVGLAAVSLPILIHLFSRRRYPLIDFSTLRFLKKLQRQQMRRLKLRQWLLLLLRTLAVILFTLAFARPTSLGLSGLGILPAGRTGVAIVLDASASMQSRTQSGISFEEAKEAAKILVASMNPGDRTSIVISRKKPELLTREPSEDQDYLLRALDAVEPWDGTADIPAALELVEQSLSGSQDFRTELYIISDFASEFELPTPPESMIPFFIPISPETTDNLHIQDVRVVSEIIEPGQPVDIEVTLVNAGKKRREDIYYSIFLNGARTAENVISLEANGVVKQQHRVQPENPGIQEGMVQIEDRDALAIDNRAYFCFRVPEQLNVILIGEQSSCREVKLALTPKLLEPSLIKLRHLDKSNWDTVPINQSNVLIFCDPPAFGPTQISRLIHFVNNGGGLLIIPGDYTDLAAMNRDLLNRLGTFKWGEKIGRPNQGDTFLSWQIPDLESPIFRGIFRPGSQPSSPKFYQAIILRGRGADVPISFNDGTPFISVTEYGKGKIILCASSPSPLWSDWGQRGIFAPLLHRLVLSLAGGSKEGSYMLFAGDDLKVSSGAADAGTVDLIFPDGKVNKLPPSISGGKTVFVQPEIHPVGIYSLIAGERKSAIAVNVPPEECRLQPHKLPDAYPHWQQAGVTVIDMKHLSQTLKNLRYGFEFWKIFLWICFFILLLESIIGSSQRSSVEKTKNQPLTTPELKMED